MMPPGPAVWAHAMLVQPKSSAAAITSDAVECLICIEVDFLLIVFGHCFRAEFPSSIPFGEPESRAIMHHAA